MVSLAESTILKQYETAVVRLGEALTRSPDEDSLALDASIQRFEFCYELGWKTIKRFLSERGLEESLPREVFKAAFRQGWLSEGDAFWVGMMKDRNMTSHTYDEKQAREIYSRIPSYQKAFRRLVEHLKNL
jgi:nucleotidyltransferase substrate binding protein (TIGR01987 family)